MSEVVTFGFFKKFKNEEDLQKDKENFFCAKKKLLTLILYGDGNTSLLTEKQISEMDIIIKNTLDQKEENEFVKIGLYSFVYLLTINYDFFNKEEKNKILTMDITYENCKTLVSNHYENFMKEINEVLPYDVQICTKERGFLSYCRIVHPLKIQKDNYFDLIKEYYFIDWANDYYEELRDNTLYDEIRNKLADIYIQYKVQFGRNRYFDKFLSYFEKYNDYNCSILQKRLDDYYNNIKNEKNNNKYIPIKQKEE